MIAALVHGNELSGAVAVLDLLQAGVRPAEGRLTLAFCNVAAFDRFDPHNGDASRFVEQDLNRQWTPERLAEGGSLERARARALEPWVANADWLLDLHSMHEPSSPLCLTGLQREHRTCIGLEDTGPHRGGRRTQRRNEDTRLRPLWHVSRYGGWRAIAVGGMAGLTAIRRVDVARDQCRRFLEASGVISGSEYETELPGWLQPDADEQYVLQVTGAAVAQSMDASFTEPFKGLEMIRAAGTVIGHDGVSPIVTPHDKCVLVMPSLRHVLPGVTIVRFAR
jgi:hypothetical protein